MRELKASGFDMSQLSIIGRDYYSDENMVGYYTTGGRVKYWGKMAGFWDEFLAMVFDSAFFVMPDVGPIVVGGKLVRRIINALECSVSKGGAGVIGDAFYELGIPPENVLRYETCIKANYYIVVANEDAGADGNIHTVLQRFKPVDIYMHGAETACENA